MIRLTVKFIGILCLVMTVITVVLDITKSIANSAIVMTTLGEYWAELNRESLLLLQPAVERYLHPFFWDPVIQNILLSPCWLVFFLLAILLLWLGRSRTQSWHARFGR